ncbi:hypothetical protein TNCV_4256671 [Trichonephila clavipes]|nr:hypothetical protein TNCV_4256671 [Trichonephila clavipes]
MQELSSKGNNAPGYDRFKNLMPILEDSFGTRLILYHRDKLAGSLRCTKTVRNLIGMQGRANAVVARYGAKKQSVRKYDQMSFGKSGRGDAWNSLHSGRFLACHVSYRRLQIFER